MLTLPTSVRVYIAAEPVDLRRGHDGLVAIVRNDVSVRHREPAAGSGARARGVGAAARSRPHRRWRRADQAARPAVTRSTEKPEPKESFHL